MNFIPGEVAAADGRGLFVSKEGQVRIEVPLEATARASAGHAMLGVRSEHIHEDADGPIVGRVVTEEYLGNARNVHVDAACGRLVIRDDAASPRARGAELRLRLDPSQVSIFDGATEARL